MGAKKTFLKITSISLTLAACAPMGRPAQTIANKSLDEMGCKTAQSAIWDSLQKVAEDNLRYPSAHELRAALKTAGDARGYRGEKFEHYIEAFVENFTVTIDGIQAKLDPLDSSSWKKALAAMEVGIQVTEIHAELNAKIHNSLAKLARAEKELDPTCTEPDPTTPPPINQPGTFWLNLKSQNPEVTGILRTFATAYQSCDVLALPAMTSATASVSGITVTGNHPAGGLTREITNLAQVNSTHYYIAGQRLAKDTCFEVRNSPPIYDFGGKPFTSSSLPNELNMFKNGGSGTSVLGIDCSAFVFSALALAGLKLDYDPSKIMKADLVQGIPSTAFKEPQSNGMRCIDKTVMTARTSVQPGDIIAISGHVNIIDSTGADPFGLARATSSADCTAAKLSYTGFDFIIAQSSPSKSGIGINRYQARNYLAESSTFATGLEAYAVAACKAKFGGSGMVTSPNLSVVRHRKTAECKAPTPLISTHQDCVDSCRAL